jgi:hypothetical protein
MCRSQACAAPPPTQVAGRCPSREAREDHFELLQRLRTVAIPDEIEHRVLMSGKGLLLTLAQTG